jgi:hypothetical protein
MFRLRGKSLTRPETPLKHRIPVRTFFTCDEHDPSFFEPDTVSHCGSGGFCSTLTLTGVHSGWTGEHGLRDRARQWVKEHIARVRVKFINWRDEQHIRFTRGRPCRRNDNCFVEQKNGDSTRKTVGYDRFDTGEERLASAGACRFLCPLISFRYPAIKITGREKPGNAGSGKSMNRFLKRPYNGRLNPLILLMIAGGNSVAGWHSPTRSSLNGIEPGRPKTC